MWGFTYKHGDRPLEGYTIQRAAGRGGFGEVYYALSDGGREVALKVVTGFASVELRGIGQCMNLKSPYLVTIFDVKYSAEGRPFVVMEYVNGPNLRQMLDESPGGLGVQKSAYFLREIAKGLTYLHDCGIVHRDLKPANIFYENGYVKIGDYGLSKAISAGPETGQTMTVGTVHYMAPEIGQGKYDRSIDIYAMGCMLYELLTGTVPFQGASPTEVLMKHLSGELDVSKVPEPFAMVVRKAMARDPAERFQSVQEMVEAVFGTETVRESMSVFSPSDLSVVAARAAAGVKVGYGVGDGSKPTAVTGKYGPSGGMDMGVTRGPEELRGENRLGGGQMGGQGGGEGVGQGARAGSSAAAAVGGGGGGQSGDFWQRVAGRMEEVGGEAGEFLGRIGRSGSAQVDTDTLSAKHRRILAGALGALALVISSAVAADKVHPVLVGVFVLLTMPTAALGILFGGRMYVPRLEGESLWLRKLVMGICAMVPMCLFGMGLAIGIRELLPMLGAMVATFFIIDAAEWIKPDRRERLVVGRLITTAIAALVAGAILDSDMTLSGVLAVAGVCAMVQLISPWDARSAKISAEATKAKEEQDLSDIAAGENKRKSALDQQRAVRLGRLKAMYWNIPTPPALRTAWLVMMGLAVGSAGWVFYGMQESTVNVRQELAGVADGQLEQPPVLIPLQMDSQRIQQALELTRGVHGAFHPALGPVAGRAGGETAKSAVAGTGSANRSTREENLARSANIARLIGSGAAYIADPRLRAKVIAENSNWQTARVEDQPIDGAGFPMATRPSVTQMGLPKQASTPEPKGEWTVNLNDESWKKAFQQGFNQFEQTFKDMEQDAKPLSGLMSQTKTEVISDGKRTIRVQNILSSGSAVRELQMTKEAGGSSIYGALSLIVLATCFYMRSLVCTYFGVWASVARPLILSLVLSLSVFLAMRLFVDGSVAALGVMAGLAAVAAVTGAIHGRTPWHNHVHDNTQASPYNRDLALGLTVLWFLGIAGAQRFYTGRVWTGLLWLFTLGFLGIGQLIDLILLASNQFKDAQGRLIGPKQYARGFDMGSGGQQPMGWGAMPATEAPVAQPADNAGQATAATATAGFSAQSIKQQADALSQKVAEWGEVAAAKANAASKSLEEAFDFGKQKKQSSSTKLAMDINISSMSMRNVRNQLLGFVGFKLMLVGWVTGVLLAVDVGTLASTGLIKPLWPVGWGDITGWAVLLEKLLQIGCALSLLSAGLCFMVARSDKSMAHLLRAIAAVGFVGVSVLLAGGALPQSDEIWKSAAEMQKNAQSIEIALPLVLQHVGQSLKTVPVVLCGVMLLGSFVLLAVKCKPKGEKPQAA